MKLIENKTYFTISEAAKKTGFHEDTLKRWIKKGKITCHIFGLRKDRLFSDEDINTIRSFSSPVLYYPTQEEPKPITDEKYALKPSTPVGTETSKNNGSSN